MENFGIDIGDFKTVITGTSKGSRVIRDPTGKRTILSNIQLSTPRKFGNDMTGFKYEDLVERYRHLLVDITFDSKDKSLIEDSTLKIEDSILKIEDNTLKEKSLSILTMYFSYLKRVIALNMDKPIEIDTFNPILHLSSKFTNLKEIETISEVARAVGFNLLTVYDDLTAAASFIVYKIKPYKNLLVIDLGHSQTGIGIFSLENGVLVTRDIKRIKIGGGAIDEKLLYHFLKQVKGLTMHNLNNSKGLNNSEPQTLLEQYDHYKNNDYKCDHYKNNDYKCDSLESFINHKCNIKGHTVSSTHYRPVIYEQTHKFLVLREALIQKFQKIKTIIYNTNKITEYLEYFDEIIPVTITREEYIELVKEETDVIERFISENIQKYSMKDCCTAQECSNNECTTKDCCSMKCTKDDCCSNNECTTKDCCSNNECTTKDCCSNKDCTKDDCCSNNECTTKDCSDKTKNEKQNETQSDNIIEAIGGNSNNFLIKDFLSQMNIKTSCDPHETVSFGVTLAGALTATYNPYNRKVLDCLSDDIFIRNKEEKIKIFNKGDIFGKEVSFVQEGNKLLVIENYNQNKTEGDKRTEGDEKASSLEGSDKRTEGDEQALQNGKKSLENDIKPKVIPFNRSLVLEQNGFKIYEFKPDYPCSLIFLRNKSISIKGVTQQKNDNFLNLLKYENEMRKKELEIENIGKINNDLQTFLFQIEQFMNEPTFFSLFNEDEIKNISDLSIQLIDIPITNDLKIEEIKIQQFKCKIEPFIKKMEDSIQDKKNSILELIDHTYKKIKEIKTFTPSLFKLQSMLNGTRDRVKHLKYTDDLNILNNEKMAQEIAVLEIELEKEIKQLEDLEKKKKQETKDLKSEGDESGGKGSAKEGDQEKQETKKEGDESESDKEKQQGSKEKQETR